MNRVRTAWTELREPPEHQDSREKSEPQGLQVPSVSPELQALTVPQARPENPAPLGQPDLSVPRDLMVPLEILEHLATLALQETKDLREPLVCRVLLDLPDPWEPWELQGPPGNQDKPDLRALPELQGSLDKTELWERRVPKVRLDSQVLEVSQGSRV